MLCWVSESRKDVENPTSGLPVLKSLTSARKPNLGIGVFNSDHPEMTDAARKEVMNWRFKLAVNTGAGVQVESILTFAYQTKVER
jgi:hypothetical protein